MQVSPLILVPCWLEKLCHHYLTIIVTIATIRSIFIANGVSCIFIANGMSLFEVTTSYMIAQLFAVTNDIGHAMLLWLVLVRIAVPYCTGTKLLVWRCTEC